MDAIDIFKIGLVVVGLIVLVIGIIDYIRCKQRGWGNNPPKLFSWRKR